MHYTPERLELLKLVEELEMKHKQEESFVPEGVPTSPPLHGKVSLLPGGHLAHVAADAVVNSANNFLSTGKGNRILFFILIDALPHPQVSMEHYMGQLVGACWMSV